MNKIMENNEQETTEEVVDTATDAEQVEETQDGQEETTETLKAQVAKYKAIAERKDKKLQAKETNVSEPNKTNSEQNVPTMEDMALLQKGLSIEEVSVVKESARVLGIPALEAYDHDIVQAKIKGDRQQANVKTNTLRASGGSAPAPRAKTVSNMTDEEHQAKWEELNAQATHK